MGKSRSYITRYALFHVLFHVSNFGNVGPSVRRQTSLNTFDPMHLHGHIAGTANHNRLRIQSTAGVHAVRTLRRLVQLGVHVDGIEILHGRALLGTITIVLCSRSRFSSAYNSVASIRRQKASTNRSQALRIRCGDACTFAPPNARSHMRRHAHARVPGVEGTMKTVARTHTHTRNLCALGVSVCDCVRVCGLCRLSCRLKTLCACCMRFDSCGFLGARPNWTIAANGRRLRHGCERMWRRRL